MKKIILVLGMVTCILGLTACGELATSGTVDTSVITKEDAISEAEYIAENIEMIISYEAQSQVASDKVVSAAVSSWEDAMDVMGSYVSIKDVVIKEATETSIIFVATIEGSLSDATMEVSLDPTVGYNSIVISTEEQPFWSELSLNGTNILAGIGIVFAGIIFIFGLVSVYGFVKKGLGKTPQKESDSVDKTIAQIIKNEEIDLTDDLELVAVITAAIAASMGSTSTEGFIVRTIRKSR